MQIGLSETEQSEMTSNIGYQHDEMVFHLNIWQTDIVNAIQQ